MRVVRVRMLLPRLHREVHPAFHLRLPTFLSYFWLSILRRPLEATVYMLWSNVVLGLIADDAYASATTHANTHALPRVRTQERSRARTHARRLAHADGDAG